MQARKQATRRTRQVIRCRLQNCDTNTADTNQNMRATYEHANSVVEKTEPLIFSGPHCVNCMHEPDLHILLPRVFVTRAASLTGVVSSAESPRPCHRVFAPLSSKSSEKMVELPLDLCFLSLLAKASYQKVVVLVVVVAVLVVAVVVVVVLVVVVVVVPRIRIRKSQR